MIFLSGVYHIPIFKKTTKNWTNLTFVCKSLHHYIFLNNQLDKYKIVHNLFSLSNCTRSNVQDFKMNLLLKLSSLNDNGQRVTNTLNTLVNFYQIKYCYWLIEHWIRCLNCHNWCIIFHTLYFHDLYNRGSCKNISSNMCFYLSSLYLNRNRK